MTKPSLTHQPLPALDFTIELFCRVDDTLGWEPKPALAHLYPSEVVTLGLLYALRGQGYRAFYRWVQKELGTLFPRLPEQSRLFRLLRQYHGLCGRFMAQATAFGVCDTLGIELLHPRSEGRCQWHMARKGKSNHRKSNHRWIVGAKFFLLLNQWGQVVSWNCAGANVHDTAFHDTAFHCEIESVQEQMLVLADTGFHAKEGDLSRQRGRSGQPQVVQARHLERADADRNRLLALRGRDEPQKARPQAQDSSRDSTGLLRCHL